MDDFDGDLRGGGGDVRLKGDITPAGVTRMLGVHADFVHTLNEREKLHNHLIDEWQRRHFTLLGEIRHLQDELRGKDEEIARLQKTDRDLEAERIKANVEAQRIGARQESTREFIEVLHALAQQLPTIAAAARSYSNADASFAEGLYKASQALFNKLKSSPEILEQIVSAAPEELKQLAAVMAAYHQQKGRGDQVST